MIAFIADNHYDARPGYHLNEKLKLNDTVLFSEDDISPLPGWLQQKDCRLLILNWIGATCGLPHPGAEIESAVKEYMESGRPLMLLHGASAAFWEWPWWRELVGLRWVRGEDPDGFAASTHPVRPYSVAVSKTRHPLAAQLRPFSLPTDEIYTNLEQTAPVTVLLETTIDEGTFPQAYMTESPFGGKIASFIPGHAPHAFDNPELLHNVHTMIDYLLKS